MSRGRKIAATRRLVNRTTHRAVHINIIPKVQITKVQHKRSQQARLEVIQAIETPCSLRVLLSRCRGLLLLRRSFHATLLHATHTHTCASTSCFSRQSSREVWRKTKLFWSPLLTIFAASYLWNSNTSFFAALSIKPIEKGVYAMKRGRVQGKVWKGTQMHGVNHNRGFSTPNVAIKTLPGTRYQLPVFTVVCENVLSPLRPPLKTSSKWLAFATYRKGFVYGVIVYSNWVIKPTMIGVAGLIQNPHGWLDQHSRLFFLSHWISRTYMLNPPVLAYVNCY